MGSESARSCTDAALTSGCGWDPRGTNISSGNSNYDESQYNAGWMYAHRGWTERLYDDPGFMRAMASRWFELRALGLAEDLQARIDRHEARLRVPQQRNFERWPILGEYVWPNPADPDTGGFPETWEAEVDDLRSWFDDRVDWLDAEFARVLQDDTGEAG